MDTRGLDGPRLRKKRETDDTNGYRKQVQMKGRADRADVMKVVGTARF